MLGECEEGCALGGWKDVGYRSEEAGRLVDVVWCAGRCGVCGVLPVGDGQ